MRVQMKVERQIAVRMTAPSPLVGEGITAGQTKFAWVRGSLPQAAMRRQPLTRLRFAKGDAKHRRPNLRTAAKAAYASPTRGEGKKRGPHAWHPGAVLVAAPSPLVGEDITVGQTKFAWVRGSLRQFTMPRQPLTRLRFAQPPSPAGGEAKTAATTHRQSA
jgi:hypothetical protein